MSAIKAPPVPPLKDPKINAAKALKMGGPGQRLGHQSIARRKGLLARALRGEKGIGTSLPDPQDNS